MTKSVERASSCWEVDRLACDQAFRPYCMVVLRNKKKTGKSIVKASSTDFESMGRYAEHLNQDLFALTNDEFVAKYKLGKLV